MFLQKYFQKLILFSIPKFFETNIKFFETDTFFDTKNFRNRYRYFFRYQIFPKPIPILFSIPKFSETDTDTIKKIKKFRNREVSKPKCQTLICCKLILEISGMVNIQYLDTEVKGSLETSLVLLRLVNSIQFIYPVRRFFFP